MLSKKTQSDLSKDSLLWILLLFPIVSTNWKSWSNICSIFSSIPQNLILKSAWMYLWFYSYHPLLTSQQLLTCRFLFSILSPVVLWEIIDGSMLFSVSSLKFWLVHNLNLTCFIKLTTVLNSENIFIFLIFDENIC
jgi:hypothetical protein